MADRVGQRLGNYHLVRLLGQGGFAEVYLGEHIYLDTPAAIKVLHAQLESDDVEHFRSEARMVARLVHPNIVRVLEYGVEETTPFLVMDYAPNGSLRKQHPKGVPLPLPTIINYVSQVADALQYAHEQKVIHRDIKPENMLLGRRNEVLLSDFGIALVAQSTKYSRSQGIQDIAGTIAYMAPEQIQSQASPYSDQYSLGIVVYEWLCGTRPFQGTFTEVAVRQALMPPPSLREKVSTISPEIEEVVMRSLAKDPLQRFASVQAFARALEDAYRREHISPSAYTDISIPRSQSSLPAVTAILSNQEEAPDDFRTTPILSSESSMASLIAGEVPASSMETPAVEEMPAEPFPPLPPRSSHRGVSRRSVLRGLAGAAIIGAAGGGIALLLHNLESQSVRPTSLPAQQIGTTLYIYTGHSSQVWSVAWSPDGKRIVSGSGDKTAQVWDAVNGNHRYVYSGHTDSVYAVAWSPKGTRLASGSYDKTVQVWDDIFGDYFYTYSGHASFVWTVAWSPDGTRLASGGGDKTVQICNAADGTHLYTYTGHTDSVYAVAWSPDSKQIASASADGTVQVWDPGNGRLLYKYQPYATSLWTVAWSPDGRRIASAGNDKTIQVWDADNGDHLYIYYGHSDFVYTVAWSPDSKRIASGGDDKTVQLWDADDGDHAYTYTGHSNGVRSVGWSPDGKRIASGSWDKTVRVWQAT